MWIFFEYEKPLKHKDHFCLGRGGRLTPTSTTVALRSDRWGRWHRRRRRLDDSLEWMRSKLDSVFFILACFFSKNISSQSATFSTHRCFKSRDVFLWETNNHASIRNYKEWLVYHSRGTSCTADMPLLPSLRRTGDRTSSFARKRFPEESDRLRQSTVETRHFRNAQSIVITYPSRPAIPTR